MIQPKHSIAMTIPPPLGTATAADANNSVGRIFFLDAEEKAIVFISVAEESEVFDGIVDWFGAAVSGAITALLGVTAAGAGISGVGVVVSSSVAV